MKRAAALCAISILALSSTLPARAADKGGLKDGTADLEERVAELEAVSAKHGNKKVSVVISGQIDYGYLFLSGLGPNQRGVLNNPNSPSMLAVSGEAKLDKDLKAGFRVELGIESRPPLTLSLTEAQPTIRVATAWLESPILGTVTVGHGSLASDRTSQVSVANTVVASRMLSLAPLSNAVLLGYDLPFVDVRRDAVRWDSPVIAGFIISGSVANGDSGSPVALGFNTQQAWDVALRYAGETKDMGGWRFAAAASYRDEQQSLSTIPILPFLTRSTVTQGSASLMNMASGLFVNVAAGRTVGDAIWGTFDAYQVQAGIEKRLFKLGATTAFAEFGEMRLAGGTDPRMWGLGLVQSIDGLSVDLYADYKRYDTGPLGGPQVDAVMLGFRVKY